MNIEEIIAKKRDKGTLNKEEIHYFIENYVNGNIADYQASALLMAAYINGLDKQETSILTAEMMHSGEVWHLNEIKGKKLDKHSTGGVGDKVSLIVGPIVAACGGKFAKMSGRGLGFTGGTLDKLESIPNLSVILSKEEFIKQVNDIGIAIIGQSEKIDPADKKLYALRDVTATIDYIPFIVSSIMSKKFASGSDCIILDVKYGSGAFMQTIDKAVELANSMVVLGKMLNKKVVAEITSMEQPLGNAVGNFLEIKEVIDVLNGKGPEDIKEICIESSATLLTMGEVFPTRDDALKAVKEVISNGKAFEKFKEFVVAQGGDISYIEDPSKFKKSKFVIDLVCTIEGYVNKIDCRGIGISAMQLGAGRMKLDDIIDPAAGIVMHKKIGDYVKLNESLCTIYTDKERYVDIISKLYDCFDISQDSKPKKVHLIEQVIE